MKRIIIDCDPGNGIAGSNVDDGLALALAIAAPEISLDLITVVAGNTPVTTGYSVIKDLLSRLKLDIPVVRGASCAEVEPAAPWREILDNRLLDPALKQLWQGVRQPQQFTAGEDTAADAIGQLICANPGEITLVAIGPLTNVAAALAKYPLMAHAVKEIAIMGGVFALDGYIKDTNFGFDPEAAWKVLHSGANITLVPMDVTTRTLMTHQDLQRLARIDHPLVQFVCETMRPWIDYSIAQRHIPGCWIHDALVVAWLLNQRVATAADYYVDVELRPGPTRGKSWRYRPPLRLNVGIEESVSSLIHVLQQVDNGQLIAMLEHYFSALVPEK
ncbi:nucleoside hydrolase [Erwinia sp. OLTSP20]|uniref:nucleoside hydrolase n=1 Tax=unclassified Erwinia TaxID=2622719 RepID=UPI000C17AA4B|nr:MULTISPECIES: nucleoside hydrolase [unclassified Erwinia]PIJ50245.1 nucleoside hydrolase [Erwinia sp. OAMSP11]PIJ72083.1 nucleoside hydrolase [Erwinia sp. OLSSP12]PIJ81374.1 nucleoside hydrolase [Erwinia sp. OLCASP19]PIJ84080.1 nucleoside hydrolase [Erwinia sp. OLMTSP26]PIJ85779.1 nucleoside hydrolase [Erwinia sp. OLMDSP33]